jgi:hypothetical protein
MPSCYLCEFQRETASGFSDNMDGSVGIFLGGDPSNFILIGVSYTATQVHGSEFFWLKGYIFGFFLVFPAS